MNKGTKALIYTLASVAGLAVGYFAAKELRKVIPDNILDVEDVINTYDQEAYSNQSKDYVDSHIEDPVEETSAAPVNIEAELIEENNRIVIGSEDNEISRKSRVYRELINDYYGEALQNSAVTLTLYGKVHGLGARGEALEEEDGTKYRVYSADDIIKLRNAMLKDD